MFNFLKRKKVESQSNELIDILVDYIDKAKELNWEDEEIKEKFKEKHYSRELIDLAFNIYEVKGGKMVIKKKHQEAEELDAEDLEEETEEQEEEEEEETELEKPVKKLVKKVETVEETPESILTPEQISAVLTNHEQRLIANETRQTATESRLFRAGI